VQENSFDVFKNICQDRLSQELKDFDADIGTARSCLEYGLNFVSALYTPGYLEDAHRQRMKDFAEKVFDAFWKVSPGLKSLPTLVMLRELVGSY